MNEEDKYQLVELDSDLKKEVMEKFDHNVVDIYYFLKSYMMDFGTQGAPKLYQLKDFCKGKFWSEPFSGNNIIKIMERLDKMGLFDIGFSKIRTQESVYFPDRQDYEVVNTIVNEPSVWAAGKRVPSEDICFSWSATEKFESNVNTQKLDLLEKLNSVELEIKEMKKMIEV